MSRFYCKTKYNAATLNQMWMSMIADSHDIHCDCKAPFAHLLDNIFPEGHTDRNKTIASIITRDYQQCLSGGEEERSHGGVAGEKDGQKEPIKREEDHIEDDGNVEELLAAVANAEAR